MNAMSATALRTHVHRPMARLHWAKRPLPEPPRTRRVSRWTRVPLDGLQEKLEEWLRDQSVSYTYDGD
jgi:hypothetical protein